MAAELRFTSRPRVIASAAIIAGSLFAVAFGHALGQARPSPATPHHATITIDRPATTLAGQISRSGASLSSAPHAGDDASDDHQGDDAEGDDD
jgi:hypothetical protein